MTAHPQTAHSDRDRAREALERVCARGDFEAAREYYSPEFIDHVTRFVSPWASTTWYSPTCFCTGTAARRRTAPSLATAAEASHALGNGLALEKSTRT
jgi:hypothetical protein